MFKFKQIDKDHTGTIDWWEFLNHQALKSIATNRSKVRRLENISIGSHVTNCPLTTQFLTLNLTLKLVMELQDNNLCQL